MKKLIFAIAGILAFSFGTIAQVRVLANGHVQIGDWTFSGTLQNASSIAENAKSAIVLPGLGNTDTTTTVAVMGPDKTNHSGGSIAFGGRKDVMIQEKEFSKSTTTYGSLHLTGKGGINYDCSTGTIFSYSVPKLAQQESLFTYNVKVSAPTYLTSSDARYKRNVESLENMGNLLNDLTPVSYNLDFNMGKDTDDTRRAAASFADQRRNFGFLAQEVREIFPELVYEDGEGMLSVDYNGFIPLLVDAYKTLRAEHDSLVAALSEESRKTKGTSSLAGIESEESIVLRQNRPNPFKDVTEIRCYLPFSVTDAFVCIYDLNGRQQMRLPIPDRGEVSVTVSGNTLPAGLYIYSLIADGQEIDSKRMILTE